MTYRDQICCLIGLYLPHGVDCEEWIEGARAAHERSVALKTLPELVEEESARHIPQLLQAANCENMHLKGAFEGLKQHLASLNASRTQLLQEYGQKIEALSADLAAVSMEMQSPCTALSGTEKQLMELQEEQLKLIELMERLICHG